jgi:glutamate-1-semialdehyde 2,1-aminomutase
MNEKNKKTLHPDQNRTHALIPGGAHTYSKGDDQFPANAPSSIVRGKGCRVWDPNGNEYIDWGMGLRSVILGHCYLSVLRAVRAQLRLGSNFTRPSPIEMKLAERIVGLIPAAQMVKFAKNGSDVTSAATRLARAFTGRDRIAYCLDHPFFSVDDWFIGTTPCNSGIPPAFSELSQGFRYNCINDLVHLFETYPQQIAAVILEPVTIQSPSAGFLEQVAAVTRKNGAILIFDEMITGFRWDLHGAQHLFGVTPDLATFGKALGNGFAISALVGKKEIMELGGLLHNRERVFLLSTTHGGETHAIAAALATIDALEKEKVNEHIWEIGRKLLAGFKEIVAARNISNFLSLEGYPCSPVVVCKDASGKPSAAMRTLFLQEMIKRGILIPYIATSFSHRTIDLELTLDALDQTALIYQKALNDGVAHYLIGPEAKPVFRKYN